MHKLPITPFSAAPAMTDKAFSTLQAQYALCGQTLNRLPGSQAMYATRWGMVRHLATEQEARQFLARIEGLAPSRTRPQALVRAVRPLVLNC